MEIIGDWEDENNDNHYHMLEDGKLTKITSSLYEADWSGVFVFIPNIGTISIGGATHGQAVYRKHNSKITNYLYIL